MEIPKTVMVDGKEYLISKPMLEYLYKERYRYCKNRKQLRNKDISHYTEEEINIVNWIMNCWIESEKMNIKEQINKKQA